MNDLPPITRHDYRKIWTDSGSVWIGDPCYVLGDQALHRVGDVRAFWERMLADGYRENHYACPLGEGIGVVAQSGYGDGTYTVHVERQHGRVRRVEVVFFDEEETQ
jgi:hypothetical protein